MNVALAMRDKGGNAEIKYAFPGIFPFSWGEEKKFCGKHIGDIVEEQFLFI